MNDKNEQSEQKTARVTPKAQRPQETLHDELYDIDLTLWGIRDALNERARFQRRRGFWIGLAAGAAVGLAVWPVGHAILKWRADAIGYLIRWAAGVLDIPALTLAAVIGAVAAVFLIVWGTVTYGRSIWNWVLDRSGVDEDEDEDEDCDKND